MSTMKLSLNNRIVEPKFDAMLQLSEQGLCCVCSYRDKFRRNIGTNIV